MGCWLAAIALCAAGCRGPDPGGRVTHEVSSSGAARGEDARTSPEGKALEASAVAAAALDRGDDEPAGGLEGPQSAASDTPQPTLSPSPLAPRRSQRGPRLMQRRGSPAGPIAYVVAEPGRPAPDLPIVIFLHGRGDRAERFGRLAESLGLPIRAIIARAPHPFGSGGGRAWFIGRGEAAKAQLAKDVQDLVTLAGALAEAYPQSPKPALVGFSQGAALAFEAAAQAPERWSAVVALSGFMLNGGGVETTSAAPLLATIGIQDGIIKPAVTHKALAQLRTLGHGPEVFYFDGPHQVPEAALDKVHAFLSAHVPGLAPTAPPRSTQEPAPAPAAAPPTRTAP